jgi:DNA replication protein DnaC
MIDEETLRKLEQMTLHAMADALRELLAKPGQDLSFPEKIGIIVDREWSARENRKLTRLLRSAKLGVDACIEDVWCTPERGLAKAAIRDLGTCRWIDDKLNVLVIGKTGCGKSYIGAALAQAACRAGRRSLCARVPRLVHELAISRADGSYGKVLAKLAKIEVLVLDDFLIAPLKEAECRDLLEVLEDRYGKSSTVITSQVPTEKWHAGIADPTIADAICDRLVHNAHVLSLKGPSIRKVKGAKKSSRQQPTT